jgi:hypothetical protein
MHELREERYDVIRGERLRVESLPIARSLHLLFEELHRRLRYQ